jgi:hypothetical protein
MTQMQPPSDPKKDAEAPVPVDQNKKSKTKIRSYIDEIDGKYKHYSHAKYVLIGVVVFSVIAFLIEVAVLGFP